MFETLSWCLIFFLIAAFCAAYWCKKNALKHLSALLVIAGIAALLFYGYAMEQYVTSRIF